MFSSERPKIVDLVRQREVKESCAYSVARKLQVTDDLIARLGLEKELVGHGGCVNCLEWNETGQILASASDDTQVILWDPFKYTKKLVLPTGHSWNIFSVKFMPKSNDGILVTGAGDHCVRVHDILATETLLACNCHAGRVKRIATAPEVPFMFWTAGEDGLIMQYDTRIPHTCASHDRRGVLINLVNHLGQFAEAKCVALNARRPELIAVGANDEFVRMYDRRMIKLSSQVTHSANVDDRNDDSDGIEGRAGKGDLEDNVPLGCAQYFVAGHLRTRCRNQKRNRNLTATYLTFSADGNDLLVNMGREQIYLFDINKGSSSKFNPKCSDVLNEPLRHPHCFKSSRMPVLPPQIEDIKQEANAAFQKKKYTTAINLYNKAIARYTRGAVLYVNRAAAFMKRSWDGDMYAALRDCEMTILLCPEHVKAQFRLARCLFDLNRAEEAHKVMKNFRRRFPDFANDPACRALCRDIKETIAFGKVDGEPDKEGIDDEEEKEEADEEEEKEEDSVSSRQSIPESISPHERQWRQNSFDYEVRLCGHCNTTTDIKEANFFGSDGQYIVAGSDDGSFFVWDRKTTNILRVLRGDDSIVNCLQPHPTSCLLATSGIDPVIRLWSPWPEDGSRNERDVENLEDAASANQARMKSNQFVTMLMSMEHRFSGNDTLFRGNENEDSEEDYTAQRSQPMNCRQS